MSKYMPLQDREVLEENFRAYDQSVRDDRCFRWAGVVPCAQKAGNTDDHVLCGRPIHK